MTLHITAHFSGLRYIMFHWPILSAAIGKLNFIIRKLLVDLWETTQKTGEMHL